jgi:hypothetical protein
MGRMTSRNLGSSSTMFLRLSSNRHSHHRNLFSRRRFARGLNLWIMNFRMMDLLTEVCDVEIICSIIVTNILNHFIVAFDQFVVVLPKASAIQVNHEVYPVPHVM